MAFFADGFYFLDALLGHGVTVVWDHYFDWVSPHSSLFCLFDSFFCFSLDFIMLDWAQFLFGVFVLWSFLHSAVLVFEVTRCVCVLQRYSRRRRRSYEFASDTRLQQLCVFFGFGGGERVSAWVSDFSSSTSGGLGMACRLRGDVSM